MTDSIGSRYVSLVVFRYSELLIRNVCSKHSCAWCKSNQATCFHHPVVQSWRSSAHFWCFQWWAGVRWSPVWCSSISNVLSLLTPFYQNPSEPLAIWAEAAHPLDRTTRASLLSPGTRMRLDLVWPCLTLFVVHQLFLPQTTGDQELPTTPADTYSSFIRLDWTQKAAFF